MLKPDQAKARLAIWHLPPGTDRFEAGLKALPEGIQQAARTLCQPEETRSWDWESCRPKRQAARQFDQATVQDRRRLFALIAPRLESAMEAAWQLVKTGPYQVGYWSLPFRAPRHPTLLDDSLANWIEAIARFAKRFQPDILTAEWLATWGAHIQDGHSARSPIGLLLAAVLDSGSVEGDAVFEILRQSLTNEHEIGAAGRHVYSAFLLSQRRDGWELMEKMLLAAQRQEGLRQAILESIAATHPEAFRRMLRLILDHDLIRFSSVVRAVDVWFQQLWGPASAGVIKQMLTAVVGFLEDPAARDKALTGQDAPRAFLAMWCAATEDAVASIEPAAKLLRAQSVELRYVAVRHLSNLNMDRAAIALLPALGDEDLRVALWALLHGRYQGGVNEGEEVAKDDRFERIEQLLTRIPTHSIKLQPLVWPWTEIGVKQSEVAVCLLSCRNERPATRLIPHLPQLETHHRRRAVEEIAAARPWDATTRQALLDLAGDATEITRGAAIGALANEQLSVPESQQLEGYLTRKAGDLRRGILSLLLKQSDGAAVASGGRLLAAKDANQRLAGLELFRTMIDQNRSVAAVREQAAAYRAARRKLTKEELIHLTEIAADKAAVVTLDDALGLLNQADRTPGTPPRDLNAKFITPVAIACLHALDELVHQHRETTIEIKTWSGPAAELLGNSGHNFPGPDREQSIEQQLLRLPLAEVWRRWDAERGPELRDDDGFELLRASIAHELFHSHDQTRQLEWAGGSPQRKALYARVSGATRFSKLRYPGLVKRLLDWLIFISPKNAADYLLDAAETLFSLVPQEDIAELAKPYSVNNEWFHIHPIADWREVEFLTIWINCLISQRFSYCIPIGAAHILRLWKLTRWLDEPFAGARRHRANGTLLLAAYAIQGANRADITDYLLGPRAPNAPFDLLSSFTNRDRNCNLSAWLKTYPEVRALLDRVLARILDVELNRGDIPTPATAPAHAICAFWGIENLRRLLQALGKADFKLVERYGASVVDRRESLTKLIRAAYLGEGETPADFVRVMKAAVKAGQFSADRLLQLTFLAPQWTAGVEAYFGWEQMREGVYWFLAHMRYIAGSGENAALADATTDSPPPASPPPAAQTAEGAVAPAGATQKQLSAWQRLILERTPLTESDRDEGAIDVAWFRRTHAQLGDQRWQALAAAARFAANPSQAKRAQFIANVLLNRVRRKQLIDGIKQKQLKESVRLLGLLPLAKGAKRDADLLERCKVLREYRRYANQLSGLTKPAALLSWQIGMKNLAQTAGFADPLRLEWAVGAEAVKDLAKGPISLTKSGVTVTLALDSLAQPEVTVDKGGKALKSIPPEIKKDKKIADLLVRATDIKRQAAGIRQSLEAAMCRGDVFSGEELRAWCKHALLAPYLARLVVIGEGIAGYPDQEGQALRDPHGDCAPVEPQVRLRLAHPHDLLETKAWDAWQRECFQAERMQPFKQVFRELYVLTRQEQKDATNSHRYDGQQIQPVQAAALFASRGWNTQDGVFKVFHDLGITACVDFQQGITTPLEVEGATIAGVSFLRRDTCRPAELASLPPRLFSEVMRDLDLVVSVAHAGGVDPEASASTVEMRASLVRETCQLLRLDNVRLEPSHVLIEGALAAYSVHLGSGVVHTLPGHAICLVPVHAQHRGRLFLPFVDDDPRTAEIVSKVLLLARDQQIQDPTLLEQIRA